MADKRLDQVTKVTDMAYVPVIMSDGSIGQIAKADLATVVAGIMGVKRFKVEEQTAVLDESSGMFYITTNVPKAEWIPFAFRDFTRVGWNAHYRFTEAVNYNTWRIYFDKTPSGEFGGYLYCVSKW